MIREETFSILSLIGKLLCHDGADTKEDFKLSETSCVALTRHWYGSTQEEGTSDFRGVVSDLTKFSYSVFPWQCWRSAQTWRQIALDPPLTARVGDTQNAE